MMEKEKDEILEDASEYTKEIERLENLKNDLETMLEQEKNKKFKNLIKGSHIFGYVCKLLAPFVLTSGITAGVSKLLGFGYPFYVDNITKYKTYSLDFDTLGSVREIEEYTKLKKWYDSSINSLVVYFPWQEQNGQYVRIVRKYNVKSLEPLPLFDAIMNADYGYIEQNIPDYRETIETVNYLDLEKPNDYIIEANLKFWDKEDTLVYKESDSKNMDVTKVTILMGLIGWLLWSYHYGITCLDDIFNTFNNDEDSIEGELDCVNSQLLSLKRKNGDK